MESSYLQDARIAVLGAGAVGAVAAYRLAQAGAQVTIIERQFPGAGTTGSSFAWLNSFNKTPREYHKLNARSIGEHLDLARELAGDWVHVGGGLVWAYRSDQQRADMLRETVRRLHRWGYRVEPLDPERVMREIEPDLRVDPDTIDQMYFAPREGWVNGVGLCQAVVSAAVRQYGARLIQDDVGGIPLQSGAALGVDLARTGRVEADTIINAAGPNAPAIGRLIDLDIPIQPQPGLLIVTEPAPIHVRTVIHAPEIAIHSDGGWRLLMHGEDFDVRADPEHPLPIDDPFVEEVLSRAASIVPGLRGIRAIDVRVGVRAMPVDGLPIIGFDPEVAGFYHLVMHSAVTLSAVVGQLAVDDFLEVETDELEVFRPQRFQHERSVP